MNENKLKKSANNNYRIAKLQDYAFYYEETPQTVFKSRWIKDLNKAVRKLKLAR